MRQPDAPPTNARDLKLRQARHYEVTGRFQDTTVHLPCFFCGAPDFLVHRLLDTDRAYNDGAVCKECGRGARIPVEHDGNVTSFTIVQTVGDPLPDWYPIPIERAASQ
jgi:hypothetical protein